MYLSFNHSKYRVWTAAAPVATALTAAAFAVDTCASPSTAFADIAASVRRCTNLIDLNTAFDGMLLGRGDPKTRKGKIKRKTYGKCRPKQKVDWKEWSESQLQMPHRDIPIPWPPAAKRSPVVPFPKVVISDADRRLTKEWASDFPDPDSNPDPETEQPHLSDGSSTAGKQQ